MVSELPPIFVPGQVFRTRDLAACSTRPSRLVARWVKDGTCTRLWRGVYQVVKMTKFGPAPPKQDDLIRVFLDGTPFLFTGPLIWNALRLGGTQLFAHPLVYNRKRSGTVQLDGRTFNLRRVRFPDGDPCVEWYIGDFLNNLASVCLGPMDVEPHLVARLREGLFDANVLIRMANEYGHKEARDVVSRAVAKAQL